MAEPSNAEVARRYTLRGLALIRVSNQLAGAADRELRALGAELRALLAAQSLDNLSRRQLNMLLGQIEAAIAGPYERISEAQQRDMAELLAIEAAYARAVAGLARPASASAITAAESTMLVVGARLAEQWERQARALQERIAADLRTTVANQQPVNLLLYRMLGAGGMLARARTDARRLTDTAVHTAAHAGRMVTFKANGVKALRWFAILDSKVCPNCGQRAGKLYTLEGEPIGHSVPMVQPPPFHWWCRCILTPMKYDGDPPADGGDQKDRFEDWLEGLPPDEQDKLLGAGRAAAWRAGKITLADLINQGGLVMTLAELRESGVLTDAIQLALWWRTPKGRLSIGMAPTEVVTALGVTDARVWVTPTFRKKQLFSHPDLTMDDYTLLPNAVSNPIVAIRDGINDLLIVEHLGRPLLIVVRPDSNGRILVRSLHEIRESRVRKLRNLPVIYGAWP